MQKIGHNPHDKLVKKFLTDTKVASDLLRNHLPPHVREKLGLSKLRATSETAINERWKEFHNDIVFHCHTRQGDDAYIYALIEHQATPDAFMPLRLLRYKLNIIGKYLDSKKRPNKLPNIVALVIYHGEGRYPYAKDIFSCFQNPALARQDIAEPMNLLDLTSLPAAAITRMGGADAVLKLLLKFGRDRDFIEKIQHMMHTQPDLFLSLSHAQAGLMFEYALFVGSGNAENAKTMKQAIQQTYGQAKAGKIFSLADYYTSEGFQKGIQKGKIEMAKQMLAKGLDRALISDITRLSPQKLQELIP